MGRPKGSKNKTNSGQRNKADDDVENSLNTPKHYTNIVTPKPLRQYTIPSGLDQEEVTTSSRNSRYSPRKGKSTPKYTDDSDEDASQDDIEDETYDEIVGVFQESKTQVVKKVDQQILDNMNIEISNNEVSDHQFNQISKSSVQEQKLKSKSSELKVEATQHVDVDNSIDHDDPSTDDDDPNEKGNVRIIRLGTEEVKKYAIINKKENTEYDDDDDDGYDREDREELFEDEEEAMENDPEARAYLDSYCSDKTPEITTLKVAKKYPSKQKFPCPKCPKIWNWPWELRRHLMIHFKPQKLNQGNSFHCPHEGCDKMFQWKRDMKQHERIHTGEKLLVCSVCDKKFTTRQALLHHVVVHTGEKPFQCAVCGNRFTQPANLRTHVKKRHNYSVEGNKQNKCEYCGEPHPSIVGLHQHLLEDHPQQVQEERELLAKDKAEKQAEKLRIQKEKDERKMARMLANNGKVKNEKAHSKKSKLKEWEMDYEFYIGEGLVRGVDWDKTPSTGEIGCSQCDRKFGWRYEIMFHGLCHLIDAEGSAKNKICPECDIPFKVPIGLKHHLITHTGETPFLCLHCWKSFSSHIDLKIHIKKEHLMHLNTDTGDNSQLQESEDKAGIKRKLSVSPEKSFKKTKRNSDGIEIEEKTSHYVQLDDGTYAEMVEGHELVGPGHQMLVEDQDGQKLVVVNPAPGDEPQTIVVPEQAETVYVIASRNEDETIVDNNQQSALENMLKKQDNLELVVDTNGDANYVLNTDVVQQTKSKKRRKH